MKKKAILLFCLGAISFAGGVEKLELNSKVTTNTISNGDAKNHGLTFKQDVKTTLGLDDDNILKLDLEYQGERGKMKNAQKQVLGGVKKDNFKVELKEMSDEGTFAYGENSLGYELKQTTEKDAQGHKVGEVARHHRVYVGNKITIEQLANTKINHGLEYTFNNLSDEEKFGTQIKNDKYHTLGYFVNISNNSKLMENEKGTVETDLEFNHRYSRLLGDKKLVKEDSVSKIDKNNLNLNYKQGIKYTTPEYKGFSASLGATNEFEKDTLVKGYKDTFKTTVGAKYVANIDTKNGVITITPIVSYDVIGKKYIKSGTQEQKFNDKEFNAGINFKYSGK